MRDSAQQLSPQPAKEVLPALRLGPDFEWAAVTVAVAVTRALRTDRAKRSAGARTAAQRIVTAIDGRNAVGELELDGCTRVGVECEQAVPCARTRARARGGAEGAEVGAVGCDDVYDDVLASVR
jgi:hypothetical protein